VFQLSPLRRTLAAALRDLHCPKVDVRLSALRDLATYATGEHRRQVLDALLQALESDSDVEVRAQAALTLADAEARECTVQLIDACHDVQPRVRQLALVALGEVSDPADGKARATLVRALSDDAPAIRFQALIAVCRLDPDQAAAEVIRRTEDSDAQVRYIALRLLEEQWLETAQREPLPAKVAEPARRALLDPVAKVRLAAAIFLANAGDLSGADQIVATVNRRAGTEEPEDTQAAVELAGRMNLAAARPGLTRRAFSWFGIFRDPFAFQARVALARMGDNRARVSILSDLSAWTRDTRTLAVVAAGSARIAEAEPQLLAMRGDPRRADPDAVAEALARLESEPRPARASPPRGGAGLPARTRP
jgi:HEAT repeat protein